MKTDANDCELRILRTIDGAAKGAGLGGGYLSGATLERLVSRGLVALVGTKKTPRLTTAGRAKIQAASGPARHQYTTF
jgi:hypothetical protein